MRKYYKVEFYDLKQDCGIGELNINFTNKKNAIETAKDEFNIMCNNDKKNNAVLVNKYIDDEYEGCVYEVKLKEEE